MRSTASVMEVLAGPDVGRGENRPCRFGVREARTDRVRKYSSYVLEGFGLAVGGIYEFRFTI